MKNKLVQGVALLFFLFFYLPVQADDWETVYTVKKKDTFLAIALQFNVTSEQLQAANPSINPDFLKIGDQLIIPPSDPAKFVKFQEETRKKHLTVSPVRCTVAIDHAAQCIAEITNPQKDTVTTNIELHGHCFMQGQEKITPSFSPYHSRVMPEETLPIYFSLPMAANTSQNTAECEIEIVNLSYDSYIDLTLRANENEIQQSVQITEDGSQVIVTIITPNMKDVQTLKIIIAAYAKDGSIVGLRAFYAPISNSLQKTVYAIHEHNNEFQPIHNTKLWVEPLAFPLPTEEKP